MSRRLLLAAVLAVASCLAAPIAVSGVAGSSTNPATACGVASGSRWRITSTVAPCQVVVVVGASVPIHLSTSFKWSAPRSTTGAVRVTSTRPAAGGLTGTLHARRVGSASVTAAGVMVCAPGEVCPDLALLWRLKVTVVARLSSDVTVTVTQADASSTVALRVGDQLDVSLAASAPEQWSEPQATDAAVLVRDSASAGQATFTAVAPGTTTVTAVSTSTCSVPGCFPPSRLIQIQVSVSP